MNVKEIVEKIEKIVESVPPGSWKIEIGGMQMEIVKLPLTEISRIKSPEAAKIITPLSSQIGYFFSSVEIGDQVKKGEKIGEVVCLKIPVEIISPVNGIVKKILVTDGATVDYGRPLMEIEAYE